MSLSTLLGRRSRVLRRAIAPQLAYLEMLEVRQFLSVAPIAVDDQYDIPGNGQLILDMSTQPFLPAAQEVTPPKPTDTDQIINVIGTQRTEEGPVQVGISGKYGEINVKDGGRYSITGAIPEGKGWTEIGAFGGYGQLTISGGGLLSSSNWTEAGYNSGFANVLLTGTGSRWNTAQFVEIGNNQGGAVFTVADGAYFNNGNWFSAGNNKGWARVLLTGAGTKWDNFQHFTIGENGGRARMTIDGGATLNTNNWTEIGEGVNSNGRILVRGAGTTWNNANFMEIGGSGGRGLLYIEKGATVKSGGSVTLGGLGSIRGDGLLDGGIYNGGVVDPGASSGVLTVSQYVEQLPTGVLKFDIGQRGTTGAPVRGETYDGLDVGRLTADGELFIQFKHGYAPKEGDSFDLIRAGSITGDFAKATIRGLIAPGELDYRLERVAEGGQVVLRLVILENTLPREALVDFDPVLGSGVLRNDTDVDLDPLYDKLSPVLVETPKHGQLIFDESGSFIYRAGPTYNGEDSFKYLADDGIFTSEPATVVIAGEVDRPDPPVARPDAYTAQEDTTLVVTREQGVLANDTDATVAQLVSQPTHGAMRFFGDGSFSYRPHFNFTGTDTFTYRAGNAGGAFSDPVTVTITVEGANEAPIARPDSKTTKQNTPLVFAATDLLVNDTDPDGDTLTVVAVGGVRNTQSTATLANGRITYTPAPNFVGTDSFWYDVTDGHGHTSRALVGVTVLRNDAPVLTGHATGHGRLNGGKQVFSFNVQGYRIGDALSARGRLAFSDTEKQINFVSTSIQTFAMPATIQGSTAVFTGRGLLNGREGYRFEVSVNDIDARGTRDTFSIRIIDTMSPIPEGQVVYQAGGTIDERGNIVVRRTAPQKAAGGLRIVRDADGLARRVR